MPVQVGTAIVVNIGLSYGCMRSFRSEYLSPQRLLILSIIKILIVCFAEDHPEIAKTRTKEWTDAAKTMPNPLRDPEGKFRGHSGAGH